MESIDEFLESVLKMYQIYYKEINPINKFYEYI